MQGLKTEVYGDRLVIRGESAGRTTYRVTLAGAIRDAYDQELGSDETVTFSVTAAPPTLYAPGSGLVVLDPSSKPAFPVYTVNYRSVHVRLYEVSPSDWMAFRVVRLEAGRTDKTPPFPGRLVSSTTVSLNARPDELTETNIDLARALPKGLGHVVIDVEPGSVVAGALQAPSRERRTRILQWVQATGIGIDAFSDDGHLLAWTTALTDGGPIAGATVSLEPAGITGLTGREGLATLDLGEGAAALLVARRGSDVAILPEDISPWGRDSGWTRVPTVDGLRWYVVDDRHLYRPGEEVRVKGWIRIAAGGPQGDLRGLAGAVRQITYRVTDSRNNEIGRGTRPVGALGGFDFAVNLPDTMNLGSASIALNADATVAAGRAHSHRFIVQEFRRPEFEVTATAAAGPHFVGGFATVTAAAAYLSGGSLPGAEVDWQVTSAQASFRPPNRDDFIFGTWIPWWESDVRRGGGTSGQSYQGVTDSAGRHALRIDFDQVRPTRPTTVQAQATVTDVNRQAWSATANLLVHPASLYVGLKRNRLFVQRGVPVVVEAIVTDLDGRAVAGRPVRIRAERLDRVQEAGEWMEAAVDPQDCTVSPTETPAPCTFQTPEGGTYRVTATVSDDQGRSNESGFRMWVAGGTTLPTRGVEQEAVTLVPNLEAYRAGDQAEILVVSPFAPAEGLLTLRRSGIVRSERFAVSGPSHTLRFEIDERWTPNVHVQVDLVGAAERSDETGAPGASRQKRPAFASGSLDLSIPPMLRTLTVKAQPQAAVVEPGGATVVDVTLSDSRGRPVAGGEVAVIVVDEAVLALSAYQTPDPVAQFYSRRGEGTRDYHTRANVILAKAELPGTTEEGFAVGGVSESMAVAAAPMLARSPMGEAEGAAGGAIRLRTDLNPLALFVPDVRTDANGRALVPIAVPDNVTRYRIVALAATDGVASARASQCSPPGCR